MDKLGTKVISSPDPLSQSFPAPNTTAKATTENMGVIVSKLLGRCLRITQYLFSEPAGTVQQRLAYSSPSAGQVCGSQRYIGFRTESWDLI